MQLWKVSLVVSALLMACGGVSTPDATSTPTLTPPSPTAKASPSEAPISTSAPTDEVEDMMASGSHADVKLVSISGSPGAYSFSVTVRSPDTGCDRYADWWEVLTTEGQLIYRRVLFLFFFLSFKGPNRTAG